MFRKQQSINCKLLDTILMSLLNFQGFINNSNNPMALLNQKQKQKQNKNNKIKKKH